MENKKLNLYQKLVEIRKEIKYIQKEEKVKAGSKNFDYTKGSVLISLLRPKMDELGVLLSYEVREINHTDVVRINYKGASIPHGVTQAKCVFTFINAENPTEQLERIIWTKIRGDDIQDMGSLQTYNLRYFLLGFFNISNDKLDPNTHEKAVERVAYKEAEENFKKETVKKAIVTISKAEQDRLQVLFKELNVAGTYKEIIGNYGIETLSELPESAFDKVCETLNNRIDYKNKKENKGL